MRKVKDIIIKLLIVLISVFFIDGGRSFLLVSDNIQILLNHSKDIETPHQIHTVSISDEEKWLEPFKFEFSAFNPDLIKFPYSLHITSEEFTNSIWQPPKFV
jgi:hypothetical protein